MSNMMSNMMPVGVIVVQQELRQAGYYTPVASNMMQHINWLLYNSVLRIYTVSIITKKKL